MLILEFIYKGTPVRTLQFHNLEFTEENQRLLREELRAGHIERPENWDLIKFYPELDESIWRSYE